MIHELKIGKNYLQRLLDGTKKAEIRLNDQDYQVGDALKFYNVTKQVNHVGDDDCYVFFRITHIHSGLGMDSGGCGYVCLSVKLIDPCGAVKEK